MLPDRLGTISLADKGRRQRNRRPAPAPTEVIVLAAIRARGTRNFTGSEIAREAGVCRQTVYKVIGKLNGQGHRIEGTPRLGFMAQLRFSRASG